jgi:hypothetical protein
VSPTHHNGQKARGEKKHETFGGWAVLILALSECGLISLFSDQNKLCNQPLIDIGSVYPKSSWDDLRLWHTILPLEPYKHLHVVTGGQGCGHISFVLIFFLPSTSSQIHDKRLPWWYNSVCPYPEHKLSTFKLDVLMFKK